MNHDTLDTFFDRFRTSAFRVEARDHYDVPAERDEFLAFRQGRRLPHRTPYGDPWLARVAAASQSGLTIQRVRLVTLPINKYTRYESARYLDNAAAGEHIGVIERGWLQRHDQVWTTEDFWIFDDERVLTLEYDDHGRFLGAVPVNGLAPYLAAKRRAIDLSVDFERSCLTPEAPVSNYKEGPND